MVNVESTAVPGPTTSGFLIVPVPLPLIAYTSSIEPFNSFVENHLVLYARDRNFDFGPDKRKNTSCLSPYVTHGVLSEKEIIKIALKKFPFSKIEKFIQEVLWILSEFRTLC